MCTTNTTKCGAVKRAVSIGMDWNEINSQQLVLAAISCMTHNRTSFNSNLNESLTQEEYPRVLVPLIIGYKPCLQNLSNVTIFDDVFNFIF